jgi:hypothetical protein
MYPSDRISKKEIINYKTIDDKISPRNINPEYYSLEFNSKKDSNNTTSKNNSYFSNFVFDSDNDGITNFNDPMPYTYGPYVDMNFNGRIDFFDMQISGFRNPYWNYWGLSYGYSHGYFRLYNYNFYSTYYLLYYYQPTYINTQDNTKKVTYSKRPSRNDLFILNNSRNNNSSSNTNNGWRNQINPEKTNNRGRFYNPSNNFPRSETNRTFNFPNNNNTNNKIKTNPSASPIKRGRN